MKTKYKISKRDFILIAIALIIGLSLGNVFFGPTSKESHEGHDHEQTEKSESTIWTCSMHPQIKQNTEGDCPICGMDLIPLTAMDSGEETDPNEIQMTESAIKLAEVQTYIVEKGVPEKSIYLLGKVKADERNIAALTARFGGRIEKLYVNYTGQEVNKGQKLASIYSPNLNTAQRELIEAGKYKESNPSFYQATRSKLKLWDLSDKQIDAIEAGGEPSIYFDILAPISGTVTRRDVAIGDYIKEGNPLFEVTDLSKVWIMFDAYETDLPWIKLGDQIEFTLQSMPGMKHSAKVSYIDPFINANTRVAQVRVEMNNPKMNFKPEMFVNGILQSHIAENSEELLIPKTSILWTGKRAVVYVRVPNRESPSFIYREIVLGPETGSFYVVANGLKVGEEIASNGVFKIDASAQLLGKSSMMNPEGGKISTGHNHGTSTTLSTHEDMTDEEMDDMEEPKKDGGAMKCGPGKCGDSMGAEKTEKPEKAKKQNPNDVSNQFKIQLGNLVQAYFKMKDAFVATNEKAATAEAKKVLAALEKVDMKLIKGDAHLAWMELQKPIKDNVNAIIQMKGIEMKRSHFSIVSNKITEAVETLGIQTDKTVYLEFCPMAFDDKGAYWISENKEIQNPYFGDVMMRCGEVVRVVSEGDDK